MSSQIKQFNENSNVTQLLEDFKKNQFEVIKGLQDSILVERDAKRYEELQLDLLTLLMKEFQNDSFTLEKIFNSLLASYITSDESLHIETLILLATYFHEQIQIEGDQFIKYIIKQNSKENKKALFLASEILKKKVNQISSQNFKVQVQNVYQPSQVVIHESSNLIEQLILIASKKLEKQQIKNNNQMTLESSQQEIKELAILCLFLLRNSLNKAHIKKVVQIMSQNILNVERVCGNDKNIISEYFYFLIKSNVDFIVKKEIKLMNITCSLISKYMKHLFVQFGESKVIENLDNSNEEESQSQTYLIQKKLKEIKEKLFIIEDQLGEKYISRQLLNENPLIFQIAQFVCKEIYNNILAKKNIENFLQKNRTSFYEMTIQISQFGYLEQLPSDKGRFDFNDEMYEHVKDFIDQLCLSSDPNAFLNYLYYILSQIETRCSLQLKSKLLNKFIPSKEESNSIQLKDQEILVVDTNDKYKVMGILIILEYISSEEQYELIGFEMFMKFFGYYLYDPFLYNFSVSTLAAISTQYQNNITSQHQNYIPPLIEIFQINNYEVKFFVVDTISKIYSDIQSSDQDKLYPYLKDILAMCVKEYMSKNFFKHEALYTDGVQNLIKDIIELENIELYLQEDIIQLERIFIDMIDDPNQREFLLKKNHQFCLCGLLKLKQKLKLDHHYIQDKIKEISLELAFKINKQGTKLEKEEKTLLYKFFKVLTVEILDSQELFDKIFLLILPIALQDGSVESVVLKYKSPDFQDNENDNDIEIDHQEIGMNNEEGEGEDDEYEDVDEQEEQLEYDEEGEEEEEYEEDQLYSFPIYIDLNFVEEALNVIQVFSNQSKELFLYYKKFEIFDLIQRNLNNDLIYDKSVHFIMSLLQQFIQNTEEYFLEQEKKEIQMKGYSTILEDGVIEIYEMILINIQRIFYPYIQDSDEYKIQLMTNLQGIVLSLSPKTVKLIYRDLYNQVIRIYHQFISQNSLVAISCLNVIYHIFEKCPENIIIDIIQPINMIFSMLTNQNRNRYLHEFSTQEIQIILNLDYLTKDVTLLETTLAQITEFIKLQPDIYLKIYQIYFLIFNDKQLISKQQIVEQACRFIIQISRYCTKYINQEQAIAMYSLVKQRYQEFNFPKNENQIYLIHLQTSLSMLSIGFSTVIPEILQERKQYFSEFIKSLHLIQNEDYQQDAKFILNYIKKNNLELTEKEKETILQFLKQIDK